MQGVVTTSSEVKKEEDSSSPQASPEAYVKGQFVLGDRSVTKAPPEGRGPRKWSPRNPHHFEGDFEVEVDHCESYFASQGAILLSSDQKNWLGIDYPGSCFYSLDLWSSSQVVEDHLQGDLEDEADLKTCTLYLGQCLGPVGRPSGWSIYTVASKYADPQHWDALGTKATPTRLRTSLTDYRKRYQDVKSKVSFTSSSEDVVSAYMRWTDFFAVLKGELPLYPCVPDAKEEWILPDLWSQRLWFPFEEANKSAKGKGSAGTSVENKGNQPPNQRQGNAQGKPPGKAQGNPHGQPTAKISPQLNASSSIDPGFVSSFGKNVSQGEDHILHSIEKGHGRRGLFAVVKQSFGCLRQLENHEAVLFTGKPDEAIKIDLPRDVAQRYQNSVKALRDLCVDFPWPIGPLKGAGRDPDKVLRFGRWPDWVGPRQPPGHITPGTELAERLGRFFDLVVAAFHERYRSALYSEWWQEVNQLGVAFYANVSEIRSQLGAYSFMDGKVVDPTRLSPVAFPTAAEAYGRGAGSSPAPLDRPSSPGPASLVDYGDDGPDSWENTIPMRSQSGYNAPHSARFEEEIPEGEGAPLARVYPAPAYQEVFLPGFAGPRNPGTFPVTSGHGRQTAPGYARVGPVGVIQPPHGSRSSAWEIPPPGSNAPLLSAGLVRAAFADITDPFLVRWTLYSHELEVPLPTLEFIIRGIVGHGTYNRQGRHQPIVWTQVQYDDMDGKPTKVSTACFYLSRSSALVQHLECALQQGCPHLVLPLEATFQQGRGLSPHEVPAFREGNLFVDVLESEAEFLRWCKGARTTAPLPTPVVVTPESLGGFPAAPPPDPLAVRSSRRGRSQTHEPGSRGRTGSSAVRPRSPSLARVPLGNAPEAKRPKPDPYKVFQPVRVPNREKSPATKAETGPQSAGRGRGGRGGRGRGEQTSAPKEEKKPLSEVTRSSSPVAQKASAPMETSLGSNPAVTSPAPPVSPAPAPVAIPPELAAVIAQMQLQMQQQADLMTALAARQSAPVPTGTQEAAPAKSEDSDKVASRKGRKGGRK